MLGIKMFILKILFCFLIREVICDHDVIIKGLREQSFLFGIAQIAHETENGNKSVCEKQLSDFLNGVKKKEIWSLRMLDASGQEEQGYLFGNVFWMSLMSECVEITNQKHFLLKQDQRFSKDSIPPYNLDFMTLALSHNNTMQIQFRTPINDFIQIGLCMPKSCTNDDLKNLLEILLNKKELYFQQIYPVRLNISSVKSLSKEQFFWYYNGMILIALVIVIITLILATCGTYYDIFINQPFLKQTEISSSEKIQYDVNGNTKLQIEPKPKILPEPNTFAKIILCYSIYSNTKAIFHMPKKLNTNSLPFIHGLKFWSMFYIIFIHGTIYQNSIVDNIYVAYRLASLFVSQVLSNCSYSVDTFFCLGGFLVSYLFYKLRKNKNDSIGFVKGIGLYGNMILHRYIRLTPVYGMIILISYILWQITAHEYPMIHREDMEDISISCPNYWWRNILFITTFYPRTEMCLSWSWYLTDDMQFYIVGCFLMLLSTKYMKFVLHFLGGLIITSVVISSVSSYNYKYIPTIEEQILAAEVMYDPFLVRMGPYFVGIFAGYLINKWDNKIPLKKKTIRIISFVALLTDLFIIQAMYKRNNRSYLTIAIYMGLSRTIWGITKAWLLMTCISGDAGMVNKFLSFRGWAPVSRLTYSIYLIHPVIIYMYGYTSERPVHATYPHVIALTAGVFIISTIAAFIISILFESPYILLLRMILKNKIDNNNKVKKD